MLIVLAHFKICLLRGVVHKPFNLEVVHVLLKVVKNTNFARDMWLDVVHVPLLLHFDFPCSLLMYPTQLDYPFDLRSSTTLLMDSILSFTIKLNKNPREVHFFTFIFRSMCHCSYHCDKHLF